MSYLQTQGAPKRELPAGRSNAGLAQSDKVLRSALTRRSFSPMTVTGIPAGKLVTIGVAEMKRLGVDERYQRVQMKPKISELITVIRTGGQILDPISIAERPDGTWWIVDGQQRWWAASETKYVLRGMVYQVPDMATEVTLFNILNNARGIRPEFVIHGWQGKIGELLRHRDTTPGTPYFRNVGFGRGKPPYGSSLLVRGLHTCVTGTQRCSTIVGYLQRLDMELKTPGQLKLADWFLDLIAAVFPPKPSTIRLLPLMALGLVAYKRWNLADPVLPDRKTLMALGRINWVGLVPGNAMRFVPVLRAEIERVWKGPDQLVRTNGTR